MSFTVFLCCNEKIKHEINEFINVAIDKANEIDELTR